MINFFFQYQVPELHEIGEEIERDYMIEKLQRSSRLKLNTKTKRKKEDHDDDDDDDGEAEADEDLNEKQINYNNNSNLAIDINIKIKVLIIQNIGIIMGFSFMLLMAIYSENIKL